MRVRLIESLPGCEVWQASILPVGRGRQDACPTGLLGGEYNQREVKSERFEVGFSKNFPEDASGASVVNLPRYLNYSFVQIVNF